MSIENLHDHMALACQCGSVLWSLLRSGSIECASCLQIAENLEWGEPYNKDAVAWMTNSRANGVLLHTNKRHAAKYGTPIPLYTD